TGRHLPQSCAGLGDQTNAIAFSPDGRLVAFGGSERPILLVDLATGREVRHFANLPDLPSGAVSRLAFSPDGRTLAWGRQGGPAVWLAEVATGQQRHHLTGHGGGIYSLAFSANGKHL